MANNKFSTATKTVATPIPTQDKLRRYAKIYEVFFIILLLCSAFYFLALATHSASDNTWVFSNDVNQIQNIGGRVGAIVSELSFIWFGWTSYFIPVIIMLLTQYGYQRFKQHKVIAYAELLYRSIGFLLLLILLAGFIDNNTSFQQGGWIGIMVNDVLFNAFGHLVNLVYAGFVMISFSLTGHLSWLHLFNNTGIFIVDKLKKISAYISYKRLLSQQNRQTKKSKKDREKLVKSNKNIQRATPVIKEKSGKIKKSTVANAGRQTTIFEEEESQTLSLSLLDPVVEQQHGYSQETLSVMSKQVEIKLKDFGFDVSVETITPGPVVTQFEISLAPGVKVAQIINLSKDLARALLVESVRVLDVIPGKPVIGLEIPNTQRELIYFKEMLSSAVFDKSKSALTVVLGKDVNGNAVIADLAKMPHLLVAGATGMGKSVGINAMILSILYKSSPKDVRMIMIDPKVVELASYADIPHLLTPVIIDMNNAAGALRWSVDEMERRYNLLAKFGVRNLEGINKKIKQGLKNKEPLLDPFFNPATAAEGETAKPLEHLPLIVVVIDEYADMLGSLAQEEKSKSKRVEALIIRLAQKSRAAGIHLVITTQRPSVDVITGLIKSNVPSRIAFRVSSKIDSRTILDQGGAEQLLGMGDMLYMTTGQNQLRRVHGAFVADDEVNRITQFLRDKNPPNYLDEILNTSSEEESTTTGSLGSSKGNGEQDEMYDEAVAIILQTRRASISGLQRRLRIGYNRAACIIEDMEAAGLVSAMNPNGNRDILAPNNSN